MSPEEFAVRVGRLAIEDFNLLPYHDLRRICQDPDARGLLGPALANCPHVLARFLAAVPDLDVDPPAPAPSDADAARQRLVSRFAVELLREKAPPLYDALPWNDWDFSVVTSRFRPWRTRFLVAGETVTTTASRLTRTAGLYLAEPSAAIRRYLETRARRQKTRQLHIVPSGLDEIRLEPGLVDLAIIGPSLGPDPARSLRVLESIAQQILVLGTRSCRETPSEEWFADRGFGPDLVTVGPGRTTRPCWWKPAAALPA